MMHAGAQTTVPSSHRRGENGHAELTAEGLGDPLLALFDKTVHGLDEVRLSSFVADIIAEARTKGDAEPLKNLFVLAFQTRWCRVLRRTRFPLVCASKIRYFTTQFLLVRVKILDWTNEQNTESPIPELFSVAHYKDAIPAKYETTDYISLKIKHVDKGACSNTNSMRKITPQAALRLPVLFFCFLGQECP